MYEPWVNMKSGWMHHLHHQHHGLCNNREADTQQQRDTFTYVKIYNSYLCWYVRKRNVGWHNLSVSSICGQFL